VTTRLVTSRTDPATSATVNAAPTGLRVSIVVPVLDEQARISGLLEHLRRSFPDCEVVVVDGGSTDHTVALARAWAGVRVVAGDPGRARQLNAGAGAATGEVLWFIHADTTVAPEALPQLRAALAEHAVVGGGCRIRFDHPGPALPWLAWTSNLRARHLHWIFGDQALFVRRDVFTDLGGFPDLPIMEDLEMSRRLHQRGRLVLLPATSTASARRFVEQGTLRMLVLMQYFKALYFLGIDPEKIRTRYLTARRRPQHAHPRVPHDRRTVGRPDAGTTRPTARNTGMRLGGTRPLRLLRRLERATRPIDPEFVAALARRWAELPAGVKTPAQLLGRHAVGCEGTHGVFPQCDLACTPCYHSREANRVRIDGPHTVAGVNAQMGLLRRLRGPRAHAQLIGGEVTLLDPDDHAEALLAMHRHGREPMSMTHGDIDADYLRRLALGPDGRPRLRRLSFAGHFDSLMFGRRGIARPGCEADLNPYRQRFVDMFTRLRREHGIRFFLAHNMTVTPANLGQVAGVVRDASAMGFGMLSFQPAAFLGDARRWHEDYRDTTSEQVWTEIQGGAGTTLDYTVFQNGDLRCNRTAYGFWVGPRWHPLADGDDPRDLAARDAFFRYYGQVNFTGSPVPVLAAKLVRVAARHPRVVPIAVAWASRAVRRAGGLRALARHRIRPMTFVMHSFMDAADVTPAWELTQRGQTSDDPRIRATQDRLAACHYAMAHPDTGTLVPACVQHSMLDPQENIELRRLLPITPTRNTRPASPSPSP